MSISTTIDELITKMIEAGIYNKDAAACVNALLKQINTNLAQQPTPSKRAASAPAYQPTPTVYADRWQYKGGEA